MRALGFLLVVWLLCGCGSMYGETEALPCTELILIQLEWTHEWCESNGIGEECCSCKCSQHGLFEPEPPYNVCECSDRPPSWWWPDPISQEVCAGLIESGKQEWSAGLLDRCD